MSLDGPVRDGLPPRRAIEVAMNSNAFKTKESIDRCKRPRVFEEDQWERKYSSSTDFGRSVAVFSLPMSTLTTLNGALMKILMLYQLAAL